LPATTPKTFVSLFLAMADDLDDFFNDLDQIETEAIQEETDLKVRESKESASSEDQPGQSNGEAGPPTKRQKVRGTKLYATTVPPIRPKGVVVAASSSVIASKPSDPLSTADAPNSSVLAPSHAASVGVGYPTPSLMNLALPPLPPGPPPPPPQSSAALEGSSKLSKPVKRVAAGKVWVDTTLSEWPENDFRIFVGNLSRDVTDAQLLEHFQTKYASTAMAKIVKDHKTEVSKGYGFVSFLQPLDCAKAIREQDQKWLGARPIRVKRSDWKDRSMSEVQKKQKKEKKKEKRFGGL
jgi:hypothetical protein